MLSIKVGKGTTKTSIRMSPKSNVEAGKVELPSIHEKPGSITSGSGKIISYRYTQVPNLDNSYSDI
jgi:hypothetical protein